MLYVSFGHIESMYIYDDICISTSMYISDKPGWETIHALANSSKGSFSCIKPQTDTERFVCKGHSHGRTPSDGGGGDIIIGGHICYQQKSQQT